jgi:hypothetical protein
MTEQGECDGPGNFLGGNWQATNWWLAWKTYCWKKDSSGFPKNSEAELKYEEYEE